MSTGTAPNPTPRDTDPIDPGGRPHARPGLAQPPGGPAGTPGPGLADRIEPGRVPPNAGSATATAASPELAHQSVAGPAGPRQPPAVRPESALLGGGLFTRESAFAGDEVPAFDEARAFEAGRLAYGDSVASRLARLEAAVRAASPPGMPEAQIGRDDRVHVQNTTQYPFRCICHLRITFRTPNNQFVFAVGTGWAIGKRTLVTAGHCVFVPRNDEVGLRNAWAERVEVIFGRNGDQQPFGSFTVPTSNLRTTNGWLTVGERADQGDRAVQAVDYAAVILNQDLPSDFGAFGFGLHEDAELTGRTVNVVGYPGEFKQPPRQGTLWGSDQPPLLTPTAIQLVYRIDTTRGQSGAPVFYVRPGIGDAIAVGVHNYGVEDDRNFAARIIRPVRDNFRLWRDQGGGA